MSRFFELARRWLPTHPENASRSLGRRRLERSGRRPIVEPVEGRVLLSVASLHAHAETLELGRSAHVATGHAASDAPQALKDATTLTDVSVNAARGGKTILSATLTSNGAPVTNAVVRFQVRGRPVGIAITDANGIASGSTARLTGGRPTIIPGVVKAVYAGDPSHLRSVSRGNLTVSATSTSLTLSPAEGPYSDSAFVQVKLTSRGKPMLEGQVIRFYLNGQNIGEATTNSFGRTSSWLSLRQTTLNAGVHPNVITAVYEGSKAARRSIAVGTLTVERAPLSILLGDLAQTYDGTPKLVTTGVYRVPIGWKGTINYSGVPLSITYTDSSGHLVDAPVSVGSYQVNATVADPNYVGESSGTLVISPP